MEKVRYCSEVRGSEDAGQRPAWRGTQNYTEKVSSLNAVGDSARKQRQRRGVHCSKAVQTKSTVETRKQRRRNRTCW
jgi:hypothetical protein